MKQQQRKTWESYACIRLTTLIGAEQSYPPMDQTFAHGLPTALLLQEARLQPHCEQCGRILTAFPVRLRAYDRRIEYMKRSPAYERRYSYGRHRCPGRVRGRSLSPRRGAE